MAASDIGIDLGTASILVYAKGKGIVLKEPSVVAYDKDSNKIRAVGEEARQMIGRTPGNIVAVRPLRQGVISDFEVTEKMLKYFISKAIGRRAFRKPRISICAPSGITEVEKKAVEEATYQAGAREVSIIEEPIAAAIGAGIDITKPFGNMIVDIGGGTTDVAVISIMEVPDVPGMSFKVFGALASRNINVDIILQSTGRGGNKDLIFTVPLGEAENAVEVLKENQPRFGGKEIRVEKNYAKVSVVGAGMQSNPGVASRMFEALFEANVNIHMISTSEIKISVIIDESEADRAVSAIHSVFIP